MTAKQKIAKAVESGNYVVIVKHQFYNRSVIKSSFEVQGVDGVYSLTTQQFRKMNLFEMGFEITFEGVDTTVYKANHNA